MRVLALSLLAVAAVSCSSPQPVDHRQSRGIYANEINGGQFNFLIGARELEDDAVWGELGEQVGVGVDFVFGPFDNFLQWDVAVNYGWDEVTTLTGASATAQTVEGSIGLIHFFRFGNQAMVPYVGAGVSGIYAETELIGNGAVDVSDWSFAGYARAGLQFRMRDDEHIGLDIRAVGGSSLNFAGVDTTADALVFSLVFGNQY